MVITKTNNILIVLLSLTFSILFYYFRDINAAIDSNSAISAGGRGVSDLSRYFGSYNKKTINDISAMGIFNNSLYHWIAFFFKQIGVKFELFVFILILSYYIVFAKLSNALININRWYIIFVVFCILTFWLIPLTTVAIRQGLAILTLAAFWPFLEKKKSLFLEIFIILLVSNIHTTALSLLPFIVFKRLFIRRLFLLDFILFIILILYIFNFFVFANIHVLSLLEYLHIDTRSFNLKSDHYIRGFSVYKATAFMIPVVLYRGPIYLNYQRFKHLKGVYIFYVYFGMLAIFLSGLPYHDRVFLYAWAFSPILLTSFVINILPLKTQSKHRQHFL